MRTFLDLVIMKMKMTFSFVDSTYKVSKENNWQKYICQIPYTLSHVKLFIISNSAISHILSQFFLIRAKKLSLFPNFCSQISQLIPNPTVILLISRVSKIGEVVE